jgi:hypothetical protein
MARFSFNDAWDAIRKPFAGSNLGKTLGTQGRDVNFDPAIEQEQGDFAAYLKARSQGQGQSLAQMQTERGLRENERQGVQAIKSMGSVSPALRQRMIAQRQAQTGADIASRGGEAEMAERLNQQQLYASLLEQRRKQRMEEEAMRQGAHTSKMESRSGLIRGLASAGATAASAGGACWVARAVFGEDNPKWLMARIFVVNISPEWFKNLYLKHGEQFAEVVKKNKLLKLAIKPIFEVFAFIGENHARAKLC